MVFNEPVFLDILLLGFAKLKPLFGIGLSIIIALIVGYMDSISHELSLSRTFVFFPFFLIGYHFTKDRLKQLTKPSIRITSFVLMLIVLVGFYVYSDFSVKWLYGSSPYSEIDEVAIISMFTRLGVICLSLLMVFSFLSFIPLGRIFLPIPEKKQSMCTCYKALLFNSFVKVNGKVTLMIS